MSFEFPSSLKKGRVISQIAELVYDQGPMSGYEVIQITGAHKSIVSEIFIRLHEARAVYIKGWTHPGNSNCLAPVWGWRTHPNQRDAKRPRRKSRTEINQDWNRNHAAIRSVKQKVKRGSAASVWAGLI